MSFFSPNTPSSSDLPTMTALAMFASAMWQATGCLTAGCGKTPRPWKEATRQTAQNLDKSHGEWWTDKLRAAKRFNRWFLKHDIFFFSTSGFLKTDSPTKCFAWWCWARRVPVDIVSKSQSLLSAFWTTGLPFTALSAEWCVIAYLKMYA